MNASERWWASSPLQQLCLDLQTEAHSADMDATLVETRKQEALVPAYKKYRAYQPLITYWSELRV